MADETDADLTIVQLSAALREANVAAHSAEERALAAEAEAARLRGVVEAAKGHFQHITEYWNQSETEGAMSDALWEILATAHGALAALEAK